MSSPAIELLDFGFSNRFNSILRVSLCSFTGALSGVPFLLDSSQVFMAIVKATGCKSLRPTSA